MLWTLISPSALFYLIAYTNAPPGTGGDNYIQSTAWFYAYIACTVAFFGFAFYIVGRRESGFVRSFIYSVDAKSIFLAAHLLCYITTATLYCVIFYLITKPGFGEYGFFELTDILYRFLTCFIIFCSPALLLANRRLKFQTANTLISILIFSMVLLALLPSRNPSAVFEIANFLNIFLLSKNIMADSTRPLFLTLSFTSLLAITLAFTAKTLRINPVWSRY